MNYLEEYYLLIIRILSPYYYLYIETLNIMFSHAEEDDSFVMDWEEFVVEIPNLEMLCDLIYKTRYEINTYVINAFQNNTSIRF